MLTAQSYSLLESGCARSMNRIVWQSRLACWCSTGSLTLSVYRHSLSSSSKTMPSRSCNACITSQTRLLYVLQQEMSSTVVSIKSRSVPEPIVCFIYYMARRLCHKARLQTILDTIRRQDWVRTSCPDRNFR